jgi:hypothetical protein
MITSPQTVRVQRDGVGYDATISWHYEDRGWRVVIVCAAFEQVEARADDAFEALAQVRDQLEPQGWRIGVAGAQAGVWPSGMARDQGGGLSAYRMSDQVVGEVVDTFEPVDPSTVTTVAAQRSAARVLVEGPQHQRRSAEATRNPGAEESR